MAVKKAPPKPELPVHRFETPRAWEEWLAQNHASSPGLWLQFAKKASRFPSVNYDQALDVALCYGWIDGQVKPVSTDFYVQRWTPRRSKSVWSKRNRDKVLALIETGRMQPAGLAQIESAKADGRWDAAYDSPKSSTVPDDLAAALQKRPRAKAFFESLDGRNRYAILHRLQLAKKPETRAKRLKDFIEMLEEKRKLYP